ncbi:helix-turn-helix domain-containing protein [Pontibacter silvestris]|uniref:Helix-turn-helix domain-containing protein n=1 Tax=Pontibacter silvestris TaxID=2305183 RepID=A0ABW4WZM0_9BACT|nr:helix-turn-helix domain-containing protein [Pontibacter silvestris]MCC9135425.1 hypothetical protein [Pontibacter silvestris]
MKNNTHKGEVIREAIKSSGVAIGVVAEKLGVSRKTLYNKFKEANIPYSFILRLGEVIHYDFSQDFPNLSKNVKKDVNPQAQNTTGNLLLPFDGGTTPQKENNPNALKESESELVTLQRKYITLLEKFNELLLKTAEK